MRDFKKQRGRGRGKQYLRMLIGLGMMSVLALVAFGTAQATWGMYQKFGEASAANSAATAELATMQAQYASVSTTVEALGTPRGLEAAVRARYGVGRPHEGEIDIVRQVGTTSPQGQGSQNWFERLWHAVFIW